MLTSFFSKSKPINFIAVALYLVLTCILCLFFYKNFEINITGIFNKALIICGYLFLLFLLNFIIKKNKLAKNNSYAILFFSSFLLMFPSILEEYRLVFSNLFLILSLRRIISLPSGKNTEKKILDASIWIAIATLFYFWSILFLVVLIITILKTNIKKGKLLLIPFVGLCSVFVLTTVYYLIKYDDFFWFLNLDTSFGFNFSNYFSLSLLISISFLAVTLIASVFQKTVNNATVPLKEKLKFNILYIYLLVSLILLLIVPIKNGSEFIFLFTPLAIFVANFMASGIKFWIKETYIWIAVTLPFLIYFL